MKTMTRAMFAGAIWGVCLTGIGAAQERQPAGRSDKPAAAAQPDGDAFFKASDLIGMKVQGTGDKELGNVQDLFIDARTHQIEYVILDTGVFADLGGKQPVIPWVLIEPHFIGEADDHFLMTPLTAERLRTAPTIDTGKVQLGRTAPWIAQVDRFYAEDIKQRNVARPDLDRDSPATRDPARPGGLKPQPRPGTEPPETNPKPEPGTRKPQPQ